MVSYACQWWKTHWVESRRVEGTVCFSVMNVFCTMLQRRILCSLSATDTFFLPLQMKCLMWCSSMWQPSGGRTVHSSCQTTQSHHLLWVSVYSDVSVRCWEVYSLVTDTVGSLNFFHSHFSSNRSNMRDSHSKERLSSCRDVMPVKKKKKKGCHPILLALPAPLRLQTQDKLQQGPLRTPLLLDNKCYQFNWLMKATCALYDSSRVYPSALGSLRWKTVSV